MNFSFYEKYINTHTKGRNDVTPIFGNPQVFSHMIADLQKPFRRAHYDTIAGLDAIGFIIGGAMAQIHKVGFVPIRKGGKLPGVHGTVVRTTFTDYTRQRKQFEINRRAIRRGDRVLIVDDWIETGAQAKAAIRLIERFGGIVVGVSVLCAHHNRRTQSLFDTYHLKAIKILKEKQ